MTEHSMVSIVASFPLQDVNDIRELISDKLRNPASDDFRDKISQKGEDHFLHFASLHAISGSAGDKGYLILEFSADGEATAAISKIADRVGELFRPILQCVDQFGENADVEQFLLDHRIENGFGMWDEPGIAFSGTPGLSVADIGRENELKHHVARLLDQQGTAAPLDQIEKVRVALRSDENWSWALRPPPSAPNRPSEPPSVLSSIGFLAWPFMRDFAWPLLLATFLASLFLNWPNAWVWQDLGDMRHWQMAEWVRVASQLLAVTLGTIGLTLLFSVIAAGALYLKFRRAEETDWLSDRYPDDTELAKIFEHENDPNHVQNHMVSHTVRKPGWLRKLTNRLAFFIVANLTARNPKVGFLGDIGTIHFARWITIPGTRDLLFFSNYGGSWESYLEDFITKAHEGLTAVWSNTIGFPRSKNLFQDGATDGERFKRYARQSMSYTPFWYSAYPTLSTSNIRANHLVRRGLAAALGEEDAEEWLSLFGSAPRPQDTLEVSQMQSLLFGGMGFKPDGKLLLLTLSDQVEHNRTFLDMVMPFIAFGDGRYYTQRGLITFAPSADGLAKLGLPSDTLQSFPAAFRAGMHKPGRNRILGDIGKNDPKNWEWGNKGHDLALLVYGNKPDSSDLGEAEELAQSIEETASDLGILIDHRIELAAVDKSEGPPKEPFGFADGISQPAMRGTYRGLRNADPIHLVEPGEFVLGYPDNRNNFPPGPTMDARHDPQMRLPVAGKPQGFAETRADNPRLPAYNGSFLVIRQLEQDVDGFEQFCRREGNRLRDAFPEIPVTAPMEEFVGAKMIGRWKDGSSLIRNPYISATDLRDIQNRSQQPPTSRPKGDEIEHAPSIDATKGGGLQTSNVKAEKPIRIDNGFLYGTEDPQGLRCPFGAHIRRTNPRESFSPGSQDQLDISNRHRLLRVGRGYKSKDGTETAGLMFMCLNADLERQFEFVQQTWMNSTKFHGLEVEADPIAVNDQTAQEGFTIPTRRGPVTLGKLPQFVTMRGGGYFFVAGRQLLEFLTSD